MSEIRIPCKDSETPDDWFIARDGKQYPSDELVTHDEVAEAVAAIEADGTTLPADARDRLAERMEADARKAALIRRRHARDACHESCYFRTQCLGLALEDDNLVHGTWGGYYEEEIREIRREKARHDRARKG